MSPAEIRARLLGHFDPEAIRAHQVHAGTVEPETEIERLDAEHARLRRMQEAWTQRLPAPLWTAQDLHRPTPTQPDDVRQAIVELREAAAAFLQIADLLEGMQNG